jgi:hypothetical protein
MWYQTNKNVGHILTLIRITYRKKKKKNSSKSKKRKKNKSDPDSKEHKNLKKVTKQEKKRKNKTFKEKDTKHVKEFKESQRNSKINSNLNKLKSKLPEQKDQINIKKEFNNKSKMKQIHPYVENINFSNETKIVLKLDKGAFGKSKQTFSKPSLTSQTKIENNSLFKSSINLKKRTLTSNKDKPDKPQRKGLKKIKTGLENRRKGLHCEQSTRKIKKKTAMKDVKFKSELEKIKKDFGKEDERETLRETRKEKESNLKTSAKSFSKNKKVSLKTNHGILKKHAKKFKNELNAIFKEDIKVKFGIQESEVSTKRLIVKTNKKKSRQLILIFQNKKCTISNPKTNDGDNKALNDDEVGNYVSRSRRRAKNVNLVNVIGNQEKIEKLESSFLEHLQKFERKVVKLADEGVFVYLKDYISMLFKHQRIILEKFPFISRKKVILALSKDIQALRSDFIKETLLEYDKLSKHQENFKIKCTNYPRSHLQSRIFTNINDYKHSEALTNTISKNPNLKHVEKKYQLSRLLHSDKTPKCSGKKCVCCLKTLDEFCTLESANYKWMSSCQDKQKRMECGEGCGCDDNCKNAQIRRKEDQKCDEDIAIRQTWGIDFYSRKNMFHLLPPTLKNKEKGLILDQILRFLNFQNHNGWNILKAAKKILKKLKTIYKTHKKRKQELPTLTKMKKWMDFFKTNSKNQQEQIELMKKVTVALNILVKQLQVKQLRDLVRSFSKGLGVICTKEGGIPANSLIVQYFGEVYPPWLWYFKQDAIKKFLFNLKYNKRKELQKYKDNYSMEFYNIFLEKHNDEPQGTELLIIDPIFQGNYASRLSHSCNPNCFTLPVISEQKYSIGNIY